MGLGLEELLPPYSEEVTSAELGILLERELWPCLSVYYVLFAFVSDPSRKSIPLSTGYEDETKHIEWLLKDQKMMDKLCMKCSVFSRSYGQPPRLSLVDHERPKTRGMLLKALLEVKVLIIRAITQIRFAGESLLSQQQFGDFEAFMSYVYTDCCKGGVDAQYDNLEASMASLRLLLCGGVVQRKTGGSNQGTAAPGEPTEKLCATSMERSQLEQLQRVLGDALKHLESTGECLDEANLLASDQLKTDKSRVVELSDRVKRHLEEAEARARELGGTSGDGAGLLDNGGSPKRHRAQ